MQLFQNRAGLKKAYADLQDEFHLLRDRLKQQEGATIRVQEQLDALGDLLRTRTPATARWSSSSCAPCGRPATSSSPTSPPSSRASRRCANRQAPGASAQAAARAARLAESTQRLRGCAGRGRRASASDSRELQAALDSG